VRVALISSEFAGLPGSGGIGTYFDHLARGLLGAGCEVEVFTSGRVGDLPERHGVVFHHLGDASPPDFAVFAGLAFRERHQQKPFDVLECGELKAEGSWAARWVKDVAFVVRLHSPSVILSRYLDFPPTPWAYFKKIFFQASVALGARRRGLPLPPIYLEPFAFSWNQLGDLEERAMTGAADLVVVMSEEMRVFAAGFWGINPEAIRKIPNPYLVPLKSISGKSEKKTIGFLGRLESRKGAVELAGALVKILPDFPDWKVVFAGHEVSSCLSGKNSKLIAEKILAPVQSQIKFLPNIPPDHVAEWFANMDIFAFPSLWDNFPYVILEAMAAGKAIVATATGAVPEMLGDAGLIVPIGDVRAFRNALRKLMADQELRRSLGENAKKRFEEKFHPDRVMGEILEVYREAMERAKNRRKEV
jgi:glycosyltransferase involved in cell wall biosynthesis